MNYMAGTLSPEQMTQMQRQQAMVDALRQQPQTTFNPMQQGQVQSAGSLGGGMDPTVMGGALRKGADWAGGNLAAADTYGTTPFSEQSRMLAAQDAAFR